MAKDNEIDNREATIGNYAEEIDRLIERERERSAKMFLIIEESMKAVRKSGRLVEQSTGWGTKKAG